GSAEIKWDSANADPFDLEIFRKIRQPFEDLYLTNAAQPGKTLKLRIGKGDFDIIKKVSDIDLSGTIRNDYLEQLTDPLKIGQIIKDGHIVPHADIACEKILISGTKRLDQWRSTEDYTFIAPGKILLHATTKLSDWQHPSDTTYIHGGQIYTHSIEADKLLITDLADIVGKLTVAEGTVVIDENGILITDGNFRMTGKTKGDFVIGDMAGEHLFWDQDVGKLYITGETEFIGGELGWSHILDDDGNRPLDAWRVADKTTIDGGQIETDTVTALQIAVA
ncbi:unnamed protein product, partial [marine sediment metagenome]